MKGSVRVSRLTVLEARRLVLKVIKDNGAYYTHVTMETSMREAIREMEEEGEVKCMGELGGYHSWVLKERTHT